MNDEPSYDNEHFREYRHGERPNWLPRKHPIQKPACTITPQEYLVQEVARFVQKHFPKVNNQTLDELKNFARDVSSPSVIRTMEENIQKVKDDTEWPTDRTLANLLIKAQAKALTKGQHAEQGAAWRRQAEAAHHIAQALVATLQNTTEAMIRAREQFVAEMLMKIPKIHSDDQSVGILRAHLSALETHIENEAKKFGFPLDGGVEKKARRGR